MVLIDPSINSLNQFHSFGNFIAEVQSIALEAGACEK
jgi:hypothetical protein